jgi:predicted ferric reductase
MEGLERMNGRSGKESARFSGATGGLPIGWLIGIYVVLALTPLVLAQLQGLPTRAFWREFSSGLVMVGFAMMLAEFVLSGRQRPVSGRIGIDLTMRFHQLAAVAVLVFVLVHPFLYTMPRLFTDPASAFTSLQRMFSSGGLRSGVIAWFLLILFVAMAIWRDRLPFRYEIWRASHGLGAALIAVLSAHHTISVGTYSGAPVLAGFWLVLTAIALATLVHVYLVKPLMQRASPYEVVANDKVAERMWRVAIEPRQGEAIDFAGGQFAWVNFGHSPFSLTEHPYSISSAPGSRPRIEFTIKESGDFTDRIGEVKPGTVAYLDGPHGAFTHVGREPGDVVLIAGGVGFAPIMGMLRQMRDEGFAHRVTLIYGNRAESQILYRDELEAMRERLDLHIYLVLSEPPEGWQGPVGELTLDVLDGCLEARDREALVFVCGPLPMMNAVENTLVELGVDSNRIISERFKYE